MARARRGDPQRSRGRPGVRGPGGGDSPASDPGRSTPTSPSSRPRTRTAEPPTGRPRPACSRTPAPSRSASPPSTPRTWRRATSQRSAPLGCGICLCPTTERDLADGVGPARRLAQAGARLCLGTDSHALIDLFEEARAVELDERLESGIRGASLRRGAAARRDRGRLRQHRLARGRTNRPRRARRPGDRGPRRGAPGGDIAGSRGRVRGLRRRRRRRARRDGRRASSWSATGAHLSLDVAAELGEAIASAAVMSSLAIDDIGLLVTNDPALGEGPLGIVRDAALVFEGDRVAAVERAGAAADRRFDAGGRCVIPGFVDSHTHLVFAGDRAEEFAARLAGQPYEASGIRVTTEATRAASDERAPHPRRAAAGRGAAGRDHAPRDQVRLRARRRRRAAALRDRRRADRRRHLPRAPMPFRRSTRAAPTTTSSSSAARCSPPARRSRAGSTSSASGAPSTPSSRARSSRPGGPPASGCGCTATSSARAPGSGSPSRWMRPRWTTAPTSTTPTSRRWPAGDTVATFLPATDFSTRQPYPDARRMIDAGARVAIATNTNPGSSNTTSMSFCIALAVREMGMTVDEALRAATLGGAERAASRRRRPPGARGPRRRGGARRGLLRGPRLPAGGPARRRLLRVRR